MAMRTYCHSGNHLNWGLNRAIDHPTCGMGAHRGDRTPPAQDGTCEGWRTPSWRFPCCHRAPWIEIPFDQMCWNPAKGREPLLVELGTAISPLPDTFD